METLGLKNSYFLLIALHGDPENQPLTECMSLSATNLYGCSKLMVEDICRDLEVSGRITQANNPWSVILLRYFNPVVARSSGLVGEGPSAKPNSLMSSSHR